MCRTKTKLKVEGKRAGGSGGGKKGGRGGGGKKGGGGGKKAGAGQQQQQQPAASQGAAALLRAGSQPGSAVVRVYVQTSLNTRLLVAVPPAATVAAVRGESLRLGRWMHACGWAGLIWQECGLSGAAVSELLLGWLPVQTYLRPGSLSCICTDPVPRPPLIAPLMQPRPRGATSCSSPSTAQWQCGSWLCRRPMCRALPTSPPLMRTASLVGALSRVALFGYAVAGLCLLSGV